MVEQKKIKSQGPSENVQYINSLHSNITINLMNQFIQEMQTKDFNSIDRNNFSLYSKIIRQELPVKDKIKFSNMKWTLVDKKISQSHF